MAPPFCAQSVSYTAQSTAERTALKAGVYNDYHVVYPGYTSGVNTWNATDSQPAVQTGTFNVSQVC